MLCQFSRASIAFANGAFQSTRTIVFLFMVLLNAKAGSNSLLQKLTVGTENLLQK